MTIKDTIKNRINQVLCDKYELSSFNFQVEYPRDVKLGDYASNVAMLLAKKEKMDPMRIAKEIAKNLEASKDIFKKIEVAAPGFINFFLSDEILREALIEIVDGSYKKELGKIYRGKKYLLEHTSANPVHTIHIGHLRNNFLGMAVYNMLKALGAKVVLDYINNDRGTNIVRAMIGYLVFADKKLMAKDKDYAKRLKSLKLSDKDIDKAVAGFKWQDSLARWSKDECGWLTPEDLDIKSDHFDLCIYSPGARVAKDNENVACQVQEMLLAWEKEEKKVRALWKMVIGWSMEGYRQTLGRLGSQTDHIWHESEIYKDGKEWVEKGLKSGVFKRLENGAVISDLEQYGLSDVILLKSSGVSLYHTQDFGLTDLKVKKYKNFDKYIWCIGKEQTLYFKQLFCMIEQLGIAKKDKFMHLSYGFLRLKSGAMSSRLGTVVNADDLMDEMKKKVEKLVESSKVDKKLSSEESQEIYEKVMIASLKYGLLKYSRERDFDFDVNESLSLSGNSGPYLQYVYTRCRSVLEKAGGSHKIKKGEKQEIGEEERVLIAMIARAKEVLVLAATEYDPQIISDYLYKLSKSFNLFYEKSRIIGSGDKEKLRLNITQAVEGIVGFYLALLGVEVMEKM